MNNSLLVAQRDLAALDQRIARLEEEIRSLREERIKVAHFLEMTERYSSGGSATASFARVRHTAGTGKSSQLVEACIALIEEAGYPLSISDLATGCAARGLVIGGQKPNANLAGYLSRDERVEYKQGVGWTVVRETEPKDSPSGGSNGGMAAGSKTSAPAGSSPTTSAPLAQSLLSSTAPTALVHREHAGLPPSLFPSRTP